MGGDDGHRLHQEILHQAGAQPDNEEMQRQGPFGADTGGQEAIRRHQHQHQTVDYCSGSHLIL